MNTEETQQQEAEQCEHVNDIIKEQEALDKIIVETTEAFLDALYTMPSAESIAKLNSSLFIASVKVVRNKFPGLLGAYMDEGVRTAIDAKLDVFFRSNDKIRTIQSITDLNEDEDIDFSFEDDTITFRDVTYDITNDKEVKDLLDEAVVVITPADFITLWNADKVVVNMHNLKMAELESTEE